jgi:hypothetical protein
MRAQSMSASRSSPVARRVDEGHALRPQLSLAKWSSVAVIAGGGYVFAIMPLSHEFETLILLLAPVFLLAGVVASEPKNAIIGLALAANLPALLALQTRYAPPSKPAWPGRTAPRSARAAWPGRQSAIRARPVRRSARRRPGAPP